MMQNSLFLRRLRVVTRDDKVAYDEAFHKGINIIRGQNSSGKSTITHLIFFSLGGSYSNFVPEVYKCAYVMAEIEMNGVVVTTRRYFEFTKAGAINPNADMLIYFGDIEASLADDGFHNWQRYGYRMSAERRSFSNILFELLGLPEMKADSNITMHQILRLMYFDQESPTGSLFFFDTFDREITRETTSELLLGLYNENLSSAKLELIDVTRKLSEKKESERIAREFLSNSRTQSSAAIEKNIVYLTKQITDISNEISKLRKSILPVKKVAPSYVGLQDEIAKLRQREVVLENEIAKLEADISDSKFFIQSLQKKLKALDNSIAVRQSLDLIPIEYCPECLSRLSTDVPDGHCRLCKSPVDNTRGRAQAFRIRLEVEFQIKESTKLMQMDMQQMDENQANLKVVKSSIYAKQKQLDFATANVQNSKNEKIDQLIQEQGFKEGEIIQFRTLLEQAIKYEKLLSEVEHLKKRNDDLQQFISMSERDIEAQKRKMNKAISANGAYILSHDVERQAEFRHAENLVVDFRLNTAYLNNQNNKFSASSAFYLKLAARFAIFFTSLQQDSMLFPRFMFADNMEDKGIEVGRAQNLQKILVEYLQSNPNQDFQLIYATSNSYLPAEFDAPAYTIGDAYTESNKSLKHVN